MDLRPYQTDVIAQTHAAWNAGAKNVLAQLATGGGKTVIFSKIAKDWPAPVIAVAHRVELVSQISLTFARNGIRHNIIAPKAAIREIVSLHMAELGRAFYDQNARHHVAGVDTLIRLPANTPWFSQIGLVIQDEGHHPLKGNKWGKAADLFPNAHGFYPTATPVRADGKGLGRHADGIMDALIIGVGMRDLINMGYLTDYIIFAPETDLDLSQVPITASGEFSMSKLRAATHRSHITGDIVEHYLKHAPGKLGVTFAVDIKAATEIAERFRANGVPAEVISSKTPDLLRASIMRKFKNRELLQLVNVDLLGEGFDCPAIECVSFGRSTASFGLYCQQFGRALRTLDGKHKAIIIDHVGNVMRHRLPDDLRRRWTLNRRERRARIAPDDAIPLRTCLNLECMAVYPRTIRVCPNCGFYTPPVARSSPEEVDGDLTELDAETLAAMRGEIQRIDSDPRIPQGLEPIAQKAVAKRHRERQGAQFELRSGIALWAGYMRDAGHDDSSIYRHFYFAFAIDIATAQTLNTKDAYELLTRIAASIDSFRNTP